MTEYKAKLSRRNFLLAAGAGGAASAALIVAKTVPQAPPLAGGGDKTSTKGYHASAHIRNYYRTAKV
jgi:hypothetical protein